MTCLSKAQVPKGNLQNEVLSLMKQLVAELTLFHDVYFLLAMHLKALLGQQSNAWVLVGKLTAFLTYIIDKEKHCHTIDTFQEYYGAVAKR